MDVFLSLIGLGKFLVAMTGFVPSKECLNPKPVAVEVRRQKGGATINVILSCEEGTEVKYDIIYTRKGNKDGHL